MVYIAFYCFFVDQVLFVNMKYEIAFDMSQHNFFIAIFFYTFYLSSSTYFLAGNNLDVGWCFFHIILIDMKQKGFSIIFQLIKITCLTLDTCVKSLDIFLFYFYFSRYIFLFKLFHSQYLKTSMLSASFYSSLIIAKKYFTR